MNSPERSDAGSPGCGVNRRAGGFSRKLNATSHTGWARFAVWRVPSSSPIRSATRRVSSSGVPRTRTCFGGRSIEAIATASVYGACRCNDRPVILDEVADSARVELSRVRNAYKTLNTELGLLPHREGRSRSFRASRQNWTSLTRSDSGRLNSQRALKRRLSRTDANRQVSQRPALYKAAREQGQFFTQTDLAEVAETTPVTIRTRWNELEEVDDSKSAPRSAEALKPWLIVEGFHQILTVLGKSIDLLPVAFLRYFDHPCLL